jgi:type IV pilus assembly protein PilN
MSRINLLPWREERRKQRQQEFYALLGVAAVLGVLLFFATSTYITNLQQSQEARNQMLRNEIALLDRDIKKIEQLEATRSKLLARKAVIEELQKSRSQIVHLFDDMVHTIPDGVRLDSLKQQNNKLTLEGVAESNAKVSAYMRQLDGSDYMKDPDLSISRFAPDTASLREDSYDFSLAVTVVQPKGEGEEDGGDQ